jgi:hypothetical protein
MAIAVLLTISFCLGLIVYGLVQAERCRRRPRELRGDWWGRFERQFRVYARTAQPRQPRPQPRQPRR